MPTLEQLQRAADSAARKLNITTTPRVVWAASARKAGDGCWLKRRTLAHAHTGRDWKICVRREYAFDPSYQRRRDWESLMRHEVAHFVPEGRGHRNGHVAAMALAGDRRAQRRATRLGMRRCGKHEWQRIRTISQKWTERGLVTTSVAQCRKCRKVIGGDA